MDWVLVQHHYVFAMTLSLRFREAQDAQSSLSSMAERLADRKSIAYALGSALHLSPFIGQHTADVFESLSRKALNAASKLDDPYLECLLRHAMAHDNFVRGRMKKAEELAQELLDVGRQMNDPRSTGYGVLMRAFTALFCADYQATLGLAGSAINVARAPFDREFLEAIRIIALVMLRQPEGIPMLRDFMEKCSANDWRQIGAALDGVWGVSLLMRNEIGEGVRWIEQALARREGEGYRESAELTRMALCEIYLEIISGREKAPLNVILRNIKTLIMVKLTAGKRITALVAMVRQNPSLDSNGFHIGRCEMILGLLYKIKKKRDLAFQHLSEARRILSQFGETPTLARVETALAELGQ
jgi:hypothetical protein